MCELRIMKTLTWVELGKTILEATIVILLAVYCIIQKLCDWQRSMANRAQVNKTALIDFQYITPRNSPIVPII